MQKFDLDPLSIEDLAKLCDLATEKLADKIAARQRELAAEMERLAVLSRKAGCGAEEGDQGREGGEGAAKPQAPAKAA